MLQSTVDAIGKILKRLKIAENGIRLLDCEAILRIKVPYRLNRPLRFKGRHLDYKDITNEDLERTRAIREL